MLDFIDGVVVAVQDADASARTYEQVLGGHRDQEFASALLGADVVPVQIGTSVVRLASPNGPGLVRSFLDANGEGLAAAVVSTSDVDAVAKRLDERGTPFERDGNWLSLELAGLRTIVVATTERPRVGAVSFAYEVTHLVDDWQAAAAQWTDAFGLDAARFSPIDSERYGYEGTLTLFDPPGRLDRIEVVHPRDSEKAMGRFFDKRGQSAYMFYVECFDVPALCERLDAAGARYAGRTSGPAGRAGIEGVFIHPSALHGVLLGVSRTNLAWQWSGRPDLAAAPA